MTIKSGNRSKRRFFGAIAALALGLCGCSAPRAQDAETQDSAGLSAQMLDALARETLRADPERALRLGIAESADIDPRSLSARNPAALARLRLSRIAQLEQIEALPKAVQDRPDIARAHAALSRLVIYSGHGRVAPDAMYPYVMDHLSGSWIDLVSHLAIVVPVDGPDGAAPWLAVLAEVDDAIAADTRRLQFEAASGVRPPDPVIARALPQIRALAGEGEEPHPILALFEERLRTETDFALIARGFLLWRAARRLETEVAPAYAELAETLEAITATPRQGPGIQALPGGRDWYLGALDHFAGRPATPAELHALGERLVDELSDAIDAELVALGETEGSVAERLRGLSEREDQVFDDSPEARAEFLQALEARLVALDAATAPMLPGASRTPVELATTPDWLGRAAPSAYFRLAPRGDYGAVHFNLAQPEDWPDFTLTTLLAHETVPGHHTEMSYPRRGERPLFERLFPVPAYSEGWAVYAEDLAAEAGLYEADPLGRIGYLQSLQFRAARLVVDTGLHDRGWSREQAIAYMQETTGLPVGLIEDEVDRYLAWPGQAVAYMSGREHILAARRRAEAVLGDAFDLARFHDAILAPGPRRLDRLDADLDAWLAREADRKSAE